MPSTKEIVTQTISSLRRFKCNWKTGMKIIMIWCCFSILSITYEVKLFYSIKTTIVINRDWDVLKYIMYVYDSSSAIAIANSIRITVLSIPYADIYE